MMAKTVPYAEPRTTRSTFGPSNAEACDNVVQDSQQDGDEGEVANDSGSNDEGGSKEDGSREEGHRMEDKVS